MRRDLMPAYSDPRLFSHVDHLYQECPALKRACGIWEPRRLVGDVDPLGTDVCGWCRRKWRARKS